MVAYQVCSLPFTSNNQTRFEASELVQSAVTILQVSYLLLIIIHFLPNRHLALLHHRHPHIATARLQSLVSIPIWLLLESRLHLARNPLIVTLPILLVTAPRLWYQLRD